MRQIAELIGPLINGQLISKTIQRHGKFSSVRAQSTTGNCPHKPLGKVFVFCKLTASLEKWQMDFFTIICPVMRIMYYVSVYLIFVDQCIYYM